MALSSSNRTALCKSKRVEVLRDLLIFHLELPDVARVRVEVVFAVGDLGIPGHNSIKAFVGCWFLFNPTCVSSSAKQTW